MNWIENKEKLEKDIVLYSQKISSVKSDGTSVLNSDIIKNNIGIESKLYSTINQLNEYKYLINIYSTFPKELIGSLLAQLMSRKEGREFKFQCAQYTDDNQNASWACIIIDIYKAHYKYDNKNNSLFKLVQDGDAIILQFSPTNNFSNITIYPLYNSKPSFGKYDYIRTLVNDIINYRLNNHIIDINYNELKEFANGILNQKKKIK